MAINVEIVESSLVTPIEETPKQRIWLSNFDMIQMFYLPVVYFYRGNGASVDVFSMGAAGGLKASLARALVAFYPLAGRLGKDREGRPEINCSGEGVLFVSALSQGCIDDFGDFLPSPEMRQLVPPLESSQNSTILLMIQVTLFKCGGVTLGLHTQHAAADGLGTSNFVNYWCSIGRGITELAIPSPFFDRTALRCSRSPLNPGQPPLCCFSSSSSSSPTNNHSSNDDDVVEPSVLAMLQLSQGQVSVLKKRSGHQSTFRAVMGHLWRCACIARQLAPGRVTEFTIVADVRTRVQPALPLGFFGNVVCRTKAVSTAGEITSNPVCFSAAKIGGAVAELTDEYVRSFLDHLEMEIREGRLHQCAHQLRGMSAADICANSWLGLAIDKSDFGLGQPEFAGTTTMIGGTGKVFMMPRKDVGVCLFLSLETKNMERFNNLFYQDL